jgi:hypothetical protein
MIENQSIDNEHTGILITIPKDFNENKNKIKAFSENLPKEIDLPIVPNSGGLFGWFEYSVTGEDLNGLTKSIQDKMIEQNKAIVSMIQEFNTIYETFSSLDKDYLQRFLLSLKAAGEANAKALKGIEGVKENQKETKQIINQQKQIIEVLKNFKEKIEKIEHLADIDEIFADISTAQNDIKTIEVEVINNKTDFENNIKKLNEEIEQKTESISAYLESELSSAQNEITELRFLTGALSKVLKTTQIVSFASISITLVLVILIISGVL